MESGCFGSTVHEEILLPGDLGNRGINTQKGKVFLCLQLVGVENLGRSLMLGQGSDLLDSGEF